MPVEHGCCGGSNGDTSFSLDGECVKNGNFFFVIIFTLGIVVIVEGIGHLDG